jgi:hypothetical protein
MRPGRPASLASIERDQMHQLPTPPPANRAAARRTLREALEFRRLAALGLDASLILPAVSSLHEAARLAITAVATDRGQRFTNAPGSHEAVVDYALAVGLVDRGDHARLDSLRQLRHDINYPADLIEPASEEVTAITELVDRILKTTRQRLPDPRIPPPPGKR